MATKENEVVVLTTGGTFDKDQFQKTLIFYRKLCSNIVRTAIFLNLEKEYPKGLGGYAFEFGTVTGAERIKKRSKARYNVESICKLDSQGKENLSSKKLDFRHERWHERNHSLPHPATTEYSVCYYSRN